MATVNALTYIGVRSPEVEPWRDFATALLGMQIADGSINTISTMLDRAKELATQANSASIGSEAQKLSSEYDKITAEIDRIVAS